MPTVPIITIDEFRRVWNSDLIDSGRLALIADMCRANTLVSVKLAGAGHLGSSFSSLDLMVFLYYCEMNVTGLGIDNPERDVFFSSKGHDVPALYSVLYSLGILPKDGFLKLRKIDGTCGHPDVSTPGCEANSGSLGMGISKAKGMAIAKRILGSQGRVFVITGDGELQEGQIYEALQSAAHLGVTDLTVIIDHNKVQSDKLVSEITNLGDLESKLRSFGWHVARCNGHDFEALKSVFSEFRRIKDKPKILIADTIKGCGISFMEHPNALKMGKGLYSWHSGAPDDESFWAGLKELWDRITARMESLGIAPLSPDQVAFPDKTPSGVTLESVADAFGQALVEIAKDNKTIVVLDADLAADCRVRAFELAYPDRFIENGISEQDMISAAGGLALHGLLPVVNSFAAFLSARGNEQIYNNACENTKIIYVNHYAGLIPAGPGMSHQSIRDVSLLAALPNMTVIQPCNALETRMVLEYCVKDAAENCAIRLIIGPSPRAIKLPSDYCLKYGTGVSLTRGSDAIFFAYGPVMLHEAMSASEMLASKGFSLKVVNMPWLNRVDKDWLQATVQDYRSIYVLDDHSPVGGLGDALLSCLAQNDLLGNLKFEKFGIEGFPKWGTPPEALRYHGLDAQSLSTRILRERAW